MHRQRLTHRCVGNAGSSLAVIWFQLGSNEGPLNRRFFGISGAGSTVLRFVNSRNDRKLSALSGVAYEKLGAIFPSLVAPTPAPTAQLKYPESMRLRFRPECLMRSFSLLARFSVLANALCIL